MRTTMQRVVPLTAIIARKRKNRYGSIPDLPDEELADPEELERQVYREEFGPVLTLPVRGGQSFRPNVDENGELDWGAFGTVDFERTMPQPDQTRNKVEELRERLRDTLIMLDTVMRRLPHAKYSVLKFVRMGILDLGHIVGFEMYQAAELDLRARRIQREIAELEEARQARQRKQVEAMFGTSRTGS